MPKPRQQEQDQIAFLNSETAVSGLDGNFEGTVTGAKWEQYDFKGKAKPKRDGKSGIVMALHVTIGERDDGGKDLDEFYSAGAIEDFVPNDDGDGFEAITGRKGFHPDREVLQLTDAMVDTGGVVRSELGVDPTPLIGTRFYWERVNPRWAKDGKKNDGSPVSANVLVPTKFVPTKGGSKAVGSKAAGKPAGSKAASTESDEGDDNDSAITDRAIELVKEVLANLPAKAKGVISREELGAEVLQLMLTDYKKEIDTPTRKAISALFKDGEFLDNNAGKKTWAFDADEDEVTARK